MQDSPSIWDAPTLHDALRTYGEETTVALLVKAFHATEPAVGEAGAPAGFGAGPHETELGS